MMHVNMRQVARQRFLSKVIWLRYGAIWYSMLSMLMMCHRELLHVAGGMPFIHTCKLIMMLAKPAASSVM